MNEKMIEKLIGCVIQPIPCTAEETGIDFEVLIPRAIADRIVRRCLFAMRKPTEAMRKRGQTEMSSQGAHDCEVFAADIFAAMIDEALKD